MKRLIWYVFVSCFVSAVSNASDDASLPHRSPASTKRTKVQRKRAHFKTVRSGFPTSPTARTRARTLPSPNSHPISPVTSPRIHARVPGGPHAASCPVSPGPRPRSPHDAINSGDDDRSQLASYASSLNVSDDSGSDVNSVESPSSWRPLLAHWKSGGERFIHRTLIEFKSALDKAEAEKNQAIVDTCEAMRMERLVFTYLLIQGLDRLVSAPERAAIRNLAFEDGERARIALIAEGRVFDASLVTRLVCQATLDGARRMADVVRLDGGVEIDNSLSGSEVTTYLGLDHALNSMGRSLSAELMRQFVINVSGSAESTGDESMTPNRAKRHHRTGSLVVGHILRKESKLATEAQDHVRTHNRTDDPDESISARHCTKSPSMKIRPPHGKSRSHRHRRTISLTGRGSTRGGTMRMVRPASPQSDQLGSDEDRSRDNEINFDTLRACSERQVEEDGASREESDGD